MFDIKDEKINNLLLEIEKVCKSNFVSHLYLFGSYVKGTERSGSDIDIVVEGVKNFRTLCEDIENIRTLKIINIFDLDKIKNKFLKEEIDSYAKIIY